MRPDDYGIGTADLSKVSLSVGLAVCQALHTVSPNLDLGLKWPNDIHLNAKKLAGILVEVPAQPQAASQWMVLGIGININNSLAAHPVLKSTATSLVDETASRWSLAHVLRSSLQYLSTELHNLSSSPQDSLNRWQKWCVLQGHAIAVTVGEREVQGICRGIDEQGGLLIDTGAGIEQVLAGVAVRIT